MKKCINIIGIAIFILIVVACRSTEKDFRGQYGAEGYENNYDTIWLRDNNKYKRKLIQKSTGEIFTQEGSWKVISDKERTDISLQPFYMNDDRKEVNNALFRSLSDFGTVLMVKEGLLGFKLLQNGDEGWYYNKVK